MTKILLLNIPSGPYTTDYPPVGISRVMEGVRADLGCELTFIDLDYHRYTADEIAQKIRELAPKIIGFSGILTPSYSYLKTLSLEIKHIFPDIVQVLGGEMCVISNIILQRTAVDFCVTQESEPAFSNLIQLLKNSRFDIKDKARYKDIKGLAFLIDNVPFFTGYEQDSENALLEPNYDLLSKFTELRQYIRNIDDEHYRNRLNKFEIDDFFKLFHEGNPKKKMLIAFASKGCVGRCTFCHRYFKGYKTMDPDKVTGYLDSVLKKYDVGLVQFSEENFGTNEKATQKIISYLKDNKVNWAAGAVRVKNVKDETVRAWKESGCVHINFGVESCSQRMLDVMEKGVTVQDNLHALRLCAKYNILTIVGLVIGMPGETEESIAETIKNLSAAIPESIDLPYEICINYFQAVPGTEGYEFARRLGFIGKSLDEEERYIEGLYNVNANDIKHYLNFTDYQVEELYYWENYIFLELFAAYLRKHGILNVLRKKKGKRYRYALLYMSFPKPLRRILLKYLMIVKRRNVLTAFRVVFNNIFNKKKPYFSNIKESLRKLNDTYSFTEREDDANTGILRRGR
jgi:radical SAM superfamily enzyme YgiQ (UPF0313 family)